MRTFEEELQAVAANNEAVRIFPKQDVQMPDDADP